MKKKLLIALTCFVMMKGAIASDPFREGVESKLTREQIAEIIPWAVNTKTALERLLRKTENLNFLTLNQALEQGIRREVIQSAPRYSELKMRYALNRGLKINSVLRASRFGTSTHSVNAANFVLVESIKLAINHYQSDINFLEKAKEGNTTSAMTLSFAQDSSLLLGSVLKNVFNPKDSYAIQRLRVSFLQNDLYRLDNNKEFGQIILELEDLLKSFPENAPNTDSHAQKMFLRLYALRSENIMSSSSLSFRSEEVAGPYSYRLESGYCMQYNSAGKYMRIVDESSCTAK